MLRESLRPLVVVVDIDNDVEEAIGRSFVMGREPVVRAALEFALKRPEDSDVNAIFEGLSIYEKLRGDGRNPEIAIIGGHRRDKVEAQIRIRERIREIAGSGGWELYLVSDGLDELMVADIVRDIAPVAGMKQVIVEQHLSVESGYVLLARYARKALSDPRYTLYTLGIPGVALTTGALLAMAGLLSEAIITAILLVGLAMIIRGFNLEGLAEQAANKMVKDIMETPHIKIGGALILALFIAASLVSVYFSYVQYGVPGSIIGLLRYGIPFAALGAGLFILVNRLIAEAAKEEVQGLARYIATITALFFTGIAFYSLGTSLDQAFILGEGRIPDDLIDGIIESRFIQYMVVGAGLAGLIELIARSR